VSVKWVLTISTKFLKVTWAKEICLGRFLIYNSYTRQILGFIFGLYCDLRIVSESDNLRSYYDIKLIEWNIQVLPDSKLKCVWHHVTQLTFGINWFDCQEVNLDCIILHYVTSNLPIFSLLSDTKSIIQTVLNGSPIVESNWAHSYQEGKPKWGKNQSSIKCT